MSDTPRTNKASKMWYNGGSAAVLVNEAQKLERELNEAKKRMGAMESWFKELEVLEDNPTDRRQWAKQPGWIPSGCAVYVGPILKPKEGASHE